MRRYLASYIRHNQAAVITLAAISLVASLLLGLVTGISWMVLGDYLQRMAILGQAPDVTGSTIAFASVLAMASLSIVLMLKSAFEVSMSVRMRQLGLLKSSGARDAQVRLLLLAEAGAVSLPAAAVGVALGLALSLVVVRTLLALTVEGRTYDPVVALSPSSFVLALLVALVTIVVSALLPARRLSRVSIVDAIERGEEDYSLGPGRGQRYRFLRRVFGVEAEIAARSLSARRRSMRTANVSISLSLLALVTFVNVETLSHLSTQITYFERYAKVWDVRLTVEGAAADGADASLLGGLRARDGVIEVSFGDAYKADSPDAFYNIRTGTQAQADALMVALAGEYAGQDGFHVVNRLAEQERDSRVRGALRIFLDVMAGVLACIGIADVFASVLGRVASRRREVALLLASGMSARQLRKVFSAESVLTVLKPLAITLALNVPLVLFAAQVSPVSMGDFLRNMPVVHVGVFAVACWLLVLLAYRLGERAVLSQGPVTLEFD